MHLNDPDASAAYANLPQVYITLQSNVASVSFQHVTNFLSTSLQFLDTPTATVTDSALAREHSDSGDYLSLQ